MRTSFHSDLPYEHMESRIPFKITKSYIKANSLYIGRRGMESFGVEAGDQLIVNAAEAPDMEATGKLNANGAISGMYPIYERLALREGDIVELERIAARTVRIRVMERATQAASGPQGEVLPAPPRSDEGQDQVSEDVYEGVFRRMGLRHKHIELFVPENLNRWEPATETDVYMAFGVLQDLTGYLYCCGTSKELLNDLGWKASGAKPDAVLIDAGTYEYMLAEFKMRSSDFKRNHAADEVDVLVVWKDDEADRSTLPAIVLCLHDISLEAAHQRLG